MILYLGWAPVTRSHENFGWAELHYFKGSNLVAINEGLWLKHTLSTSFLSRKDYWPLSKFRMCSQITWQPWPRSLASSRILKGVCCLGLGEYQGCQDYAPFDVVSYIKICPVWTISQVEGRQNYAFSPALDITNWRLNVIEDKFSGGHFSHLTLPPPH